MRVMKLDIPRLPSPTDIQREIDYLKARIGELRALLPLAEAQELAALRGGPLRSAKAGRDGTIQR